MNCGTSWAENSEWALAGRVSAAHSTLVVENRNSSRVHRNGGLGRRPENVRASRRDQDGAALIEGSHDGYAPAFDLIHTRRIYVSPNGEDIRGQDILQRVPKAKRNPNVQFAVRFHLHPDVNIDSMSIWEKGGRIIDFSRHGAGFRRAETQDVDTCLPRDFCRSAAKSRNGIGETRAIHMHFQAVPVGERR